MDGVFSLEIDDIVSSVNMFTCLVKTYFTLALGAGAVTPLQLAVGYSMIANGGYNITVSYTHKTLPTKA